MKQSHPTRGAVIGGIGGAMSHLLWHLGPSLPPLSDLLWEWGGVFANVARFEVFGLHLLVLATHVSVYAAIGAGVGFVVGKAGAADGESVFRRRE